MNKETQKCRWISWRTTVALSWVKVQNCFEIKFYIGFNVLRGISVQKKWLRGISDTCRYRSNEVDSPPLTMMFGIRGRFFQISFIVTF